MHAETVVVRFGPLLHLFNFDDANLAEMTCRRFIEPSHQAGPLRRVRNAQEFENGVVQVAAVVPAVAVVSVAQLQWTFTATLLS
jgi:hypothetical protein